MITAPPRSVRPVLLLALAVAAVLEAVDAGFEMPQNEALLLEANHFGLLSATADMQEGMRAFLEKRPARFEGR